jgi:phosphate transport system permease protein
VPGRPHEFRIKLKVANRDLYGADFQWVDESRIAKRDYPRDVAVIERTEWGLLIGNLKEVRDGGQPIAVGSAAAWAEIGKRKDEVDRVRHQIRAIEKSEIGAINAKQEALRLKLRGLELRGTTSGPAVEAIQRQLAPLETQYQAQTARLSELRKGQTLSVVVMADDGKEKDIPLVQVLMCASPIKWDCSPKASTTWHISGSSWPASRARPTPRAACSRPSSEPS